MKLKVIDGCPCPAMPAPYVKRILDRADQIANSIYRGEDAKALLHAHGKHTQSEIFATSAPGVANPPGRSTHELRSDANAYAGPVGRRLEEWQVGIDSGQNTTHDRDAIERAARELGWPVKHPYTTGVELHHWNFVREPKPKNLTQRYHLIRERAALPSK